MTRDEAIGLYIDEDSCCQGRVDIIRLINYIFDEHEALQQVKSCEGCKEGWEREKQTFHKFYCKYLNIPVHGDFYCNRYKPKEQ